MDYDNDSRTNVTGADAYSDTAIGCNPACYDKEYSEDEFSLDKFRADQEHWVRFAHFILIKNIIAVRRSSMFHKAIRRQHKTRQVKNL